MLIWRIINEHKEITPFFASISACYPDRSFTRFLTRQFWQSLGFQVEDFEKALIAYSGAQSISSEYRSIFLRSTLYIWQINCKL